eukprot:g3227.t1
MAHRPSEGLPASLSAEAPALGLQIDQTSAAFIALVQASAGAAGAVVASMALQPVEVAKTRIQISTGGEISRFGHPWVKLILGYVAGVGNTLMNMPLEVISTKMQLDDAKGISTFGMLRRIVRHEGPGRALSARALSRSGSSDSRMLPATDDQWYVEDPFDLKHNLAGKCSRAGKKRFLDGMKEALSMLQQYGRYSRILPDNPGTEFYMKCRISQNVQPPDLLEAFEEFDLVKLHFPKPEGSMRMAQAFFQFGDAASRRRAHTKNEKYICDCQLQLHYSSQHSLAEALTQCQFSTYEMASYKMQRQVLEARMAKAGDLLYCDMQPDQIMQMGDYNQMPYKAPPPPPPPPPPQQQMYTFQDQQKMMPMAKVDPQMQMQQMYWQTHGGRATPQMMFQQPNMPPPVPPTNMQTIVPSSMHGETKPPLKSSYPKVSAKAEKDELKFIVLCIMFWVSHGHGIEEMESQKEKARAKIVNQVKPKAIQPKPVYPTRSTTGSEAWMEVKLTNYLDNILPPEQIAKLRILHEQYAKFSPVEPRCKLGISLKQGRDLSVGRAVSHSGYAQARYQKEIREMNDEELHDVIAFSRQKLLRFRLEKFRKKKPSAGMKYEWQYKIALAKTFLKERERAALAGQEVTTEPLSKDFPARLTLAEQMKQDED